MDQHDLPKRPKMFSYDTTRKLLTHENPAVAIQAAAEQSDFWDADRFVWSNGQTFVISAEAPERASYWRCQGFDLYANLWDCDADAHEGEEPV